MRLLLILFALLASSGATLTAATSSEGVAFVVQTSAGCHCYVQVDTTPGLGAEPQIFEFDLQAGDAFGHAVSVSPLPGLHLTPEYVTISVWDGGEGPSATQRILIPTPPPLRVYMPLI